MISGKPFTILDLLCLPTSPFINSTVAEVCLCKLWHDPRAARDLLSTVIKVFELSMPALMKIFNVFRFVLNSHKQ